MCVVDLDGPVCAAEGELLLLLRLRTPPGLLELLLIVRVCTLFSDEKRTFFEDAGDFGTSLLAFTSGEVTSDTWNQTKNSQMT